MNANALTAEDHAHLAEAVAKCPAGPRFYVMAYIENGVALPCEVDGAICYEAHLTEASARGAADRQNAFCAEHHREQRGFYGVRVAPSGLMCWNHETDRAEVATDGDGSLSWHWDGGFLACAIVPRAAQEPPQEPGPHDRPMAAPGLLSYRCKGRFGWIMVGACDDADALREARRSWEGAQASDLQRWDGGRYSPLAS